MSHGTLDNCVEFENYRNSYQESSKREHIWIDDYKEGKD